MEVDVLNWPAGVNKRLPSGANVSRRKKDTLDSLAYVPVFRIPTLARIAKLGLGECSMGLTAGSGIEGAGEAERRIAGEDPNEDRRL